MNARDQTAGPTVAETSDKTVKTDNSSASTEGSGDSTAESPGAGVATDSASEQSRPERDDTADEWLRDPIHPSDEDREFGFRGWVLVGVIVLAFILSPLVILAIPPGEGYRFALLIVPLVPAVLLALTAIWATTRP